MKLKKQITYLIFGGRGSSSESKLHRRKINLVIGSRHHCDVVRIIK